MAGLIDGGYGAKADLPALILGEDPGKKSRAGREEGKRRKEKRKGTRKARARR